MIDEEKAEEILTDYLIQEKSHFSDLVDEDIARDLIKIALVEGRNEQRKIFSENCIRCENKKVE